LAVQFCKSCLSVRYAVRGEDYEDDYEYEFLGFQETMWRWDGMLEAVCQRCGSEEFVVIWLADSVKDRFLETVTKMKGKEYDCHFEEVAAAAILLALAGKGLAELRVYDCAEDGWLSGDVDLEPLLSKVSAEKMNQAKSLLLAALL